MNRTRITHLLLAAATALCLTPAPAHAADTAAGRLVTPAWLEQQLQASAVLLLDASMPPQHAAGHIPGAVNASVFATAGRDLPPAALEQRLHAWGVSTGRKIVIYDEGGSWMATRLFYDLFYLGVSVQDIHLLDGGLHQWKAAGKPVTKEATPRPAEGSFRVTQTRDEARVRLPEILLATGDPANQVIVDALEPPYYYGGAKFFDRGGHIPNARLWPASDFFNADSKTFKSPDEIRRMLAHHGILSAQTVHVYCGGGGAASVPVFALRFLLGRDNVKLYNESEREWMADERGLPLRTHPAPSMLRGATWLDGWASPMLRMFGLAQISVVDVRTPEAYRQGHVPFALNVPAEVFRAHLQQPEKLAALLGAAGINPQHEAVISADHGLAPDTALAWWLLERLGQKKVSLLEGSVDDWAFGGLPIAKEPTTVGAQKSPQDMAVAVASFAYRPGATAPGNGNPYPLVYIAAGKQAPARLPAGAPAGAKLVHLPYTDLLSADGRPKAAKDLWSLLAQAGVPRYASIVSFADDAGEAAVGYFVLRLMGFTDVKVWAGAVQ